MIYNSGADIPSAIPPWQERVAATIALASDHALHGGPAAYVVGDLALLKLPIPKVSVEGAVLHDDLAAQDGDCRPRRHHVPFPWRVVRLVQIGRPDRLLDARLQQYDVGVGAHRQSA